MAGNEKLFPLKWFFFQLKPKCNNVIQGIMNDNSKCIIIEKET